MSALARWQQVYAYLSAQTKPTEIACSWLAGRRPHLSPAPRPAVFYDFADRSAWKSHLVTRFDVAPKGTYESCAATIPTTVPYGPAIDAFLGQYGLIFGPGRTDGRASIEIAYAGQNAADPDIIYRDKPGLFGLRIALEQLGTTSFEPGTAKIVQPTDDATAGRYLRYAKPLLDWYGYKG